jgi:hypothetical protein
VRSDVVVIAGIGLQDPAQMRFAQDDEMIDVPADPKFRSDLQAWSKALPIARIAASSNAMSAIGMTIMGTSRTIRVGALEHLSVTEARSCFGNF